jgi:tRNA C32,U32 (ribose-2'-O)-methylase TrmJ
VRKKDIKFICNLFIHSYVFVVSGDGKLEGFYTHLAQALEHMGYFKDKRPKALLMRRLRRFFGRAKPYLQH